jgi:hypothetical protein
VSSQFFFFPLCRFFAFEPGRLCRHTSIRTLLSSDFRSVHTGRPHFSRCCYLIIDLGSPQRPTVDDPDVRLVGEEQGLVFISLSTPVHMSANRKV